MHFAEIAAMPAILFWPKIKVATRKTAIYQLSGYIFRNLDGSIMFESDVVVISWILVVFLTFGVMNIALFWCACTARNIYQSRTLDLLRNCLSDGQGGGCKQRGQTATIWLKALLMPRLAVCSRDLHWHWINWTLLCDTMDVSMLRLAWLPIAQHVFQPALTGRLELI